MFLRLRLLRHRAGTLLRSTLVQLLGVWDKLLKELHLPGIGIQAKVTLVDYFGEENVGACAANLAPQFEGMPRLREMSILRVKFPAYPMIQSAS